MISFALLGIYDPSADGLIKKRLLRHTVREGEKERASRRPTRERDSVRERSSRLAIQKSRKRRAAATATVGGGRRRKGRMEMKRTAADDILSDFIYVARQQRYPIFPLKNR